MRNEVDAGDPRLLLRRATSRWSDTPILTRRHRRARRELFATEYFDLGSAYLAQTGQLYVRGRRGGVREGVLLRTHVPRREVEDAPPPHRVLDGRARGGLGTIPHANMALQEEFVALHRARAASERRKTELARSWSATSRRSRRCSAPFPRISTTATPWRSSRSLGSDMEWGRDLGAEDETLLAEDSTTGPSCVYNYPKAGEGLLYEGEPGRSRARC